MTRGPIYIEDENLSRAWARAFLLLMEPGAEDIVPLMLTVTGFVDGVAQEDLAIRRVVDAALRANGKQCCHTVSNTIFPLSLWNPRAGGQRNSGSRKGSWRRTGPGSPAIGSGGMKCVCG